MEVFTFNDIWINYFHYSWTITILIGIKEQSAIEMQWLVLWCLWYKRTQTLLLHTFSPLTLPLPIPYSSPYRIWNLFKKIIQLLCICMNAAVIPNWSFSFSSWSFLFEKFQSHTDAITEIYITPLFLVYKSR